MAYLSLESWRTTTWTRIAALSETRRANEVYLTEYGGGNCFFWSRRTSEERREAYVGFVIRSHLVIKLACLPTGLNDRLSPDGNVTLVYQQAQL